MIAKKILLQYLLLFLQLSLHNSLDIITTNETFPDGNLLVSENGKFAFGFFTPGSSIHRYVGVWFHRISELSVVWVANRNSPINGSSGFLSLDQYGNLVLYNDPRHKIPLWSTNVSSEVDDSPAAKLLDSGNLVLLQGGKRRILWQSFDHLTDAFLPGTKVGMNYRTGQEWSLTSWRSKDDPGVGEFSLKIDPRGTLQVFLFEGSKPRWRAHILPYRKFSNIYNYSYVYNQEEAYMAYNINDASVLIQVMVDHTGLYKWIRWSESDVLWKEFWSAPKYPCDVYAQCGAYGKCSASNSDAFECSCLPGYEPRSRRDWYLRDASGGCVRKRVKSSLVCRNGEG